MRRAFIAATAAVAVGLLPGAPLPAGHAEPSYTDCLQATPDAEAMQAYAADPTGTVVDVDVTVLLDNIPRALAVKYMTEVARVYEPLGIRIRAAYRAVRFDTLPDEAGKDGVADLIEQARALYGGERPRGVEIVHVLTAHKYGGGTADCIGGVRFPERGFSAAQATWEYPQMLAPAPVGNTYDASALLHAHEIGHNLGGHHHYANCAQGVSPADLMTPQVSHCTVMAVYGSSPWMQSPEFDTVNAAIIRGHALRYAG